MPDNLLYSLFVEQEGRIKKELANKTLDVSTGRRVRNLSDDPLATFDVLSLKKEISQLSQYSQNRLFADTNLSFAEFNLGQVEDRLKMLYQKVLQAKNSIITPDQLSALSQEFGKSLTFLLDRANEKLGQNHIFGGASLTTRPFDTTTLNYNASNTPFEVWISENTKVEAILNGGEVFSTNIVLSSVSFTDPQTTFNNPGALEITVGNSPTITVNYGGVGEPQNLQELVDYINQNYSSSVRAFVSQNPDGSYSLMLSPVKLTDSIQVSVPAGDTGDFSVSSFLSLNVFQWVDRVGEKLGKGLNPDEGDLFTIQRSYDLISLRRSDVGSVLSTVKNLQPAQENLKDTLSKQKSDIEDADIAQSITEYTRYRIAYEALMKMIASQKDLTILNYI